MFPAPPLFGRFLLCILHILMITQFWFPFMLHLLSSRHLSGSVPGPLLDSCVEPALHRVESVPSSIMVCQDHHFLSGYFQCILFSPFILISILIYPPGGNCFSVFNKCSSSPHSIYVLDTFTHSTTTVHKRVCILNSIKVVLLDGPPVAFLPAVCDIYTLLVYIFLLNSHVDPVREVKSMDEEPKAQRD